MGEGATTAVEAALLGTPAVFVHTARLGYVEELEQRFGLLFTRTSQDRALGLALDLTEDPDHTAQVWARRRRRMLDTSVDVTSWLLSTLRELAPGRLDPGRKAL